MLLAVLSSVVLLLVVAVPALAGRDYYEVLGVPRDAHDRTFACFSHSLPFHLLVASLSFSRLVGCLLVPDLTWFHPRGQFRWPIAFSPDFRD